MADSHTKTRRAATEVIANPCHTSAVPSQMDPATLTEKVLSRPAPRTGPKDCPPPASKTASHRMAIAPGTSDPDPEIRITTVTSTVNTSEQAGSVSSSSERENLHSTSNDTCESPHPPMTRSQSRRGLSWNDASYGRNDPDEPTSQAADDCNVARRPRPKEKGPSNRLREVERVPRLFNAIIRMNSNQNTAEVNPHDVAVFRRAYYAYRHA